MSIINTIEELEKKGLWQTALLKLTKELENKPNKAIGIRLLFVCWYTLIEWGCLKINEEANIKLFEKHLKDATQFLIKNYSSDPEVNFYLGYMVSLSAWYFSDDVEKWEEKASQMLAFSAKCKPDNAIYQMVYLANSGANDQKYANYCKQALPLVNELYSGKGEFNLYFREVLIRQ